MKRCLTHLLQFKGVSEEWGVGSVAVLQREIETTDRQIDELVYEVYGLTEEEIKTVEEATR